MKLFSSFVSYKKKIAAKINKTIIIKYCHTSTKNELYFFQYSFSFPITVKLRITLNKAHLNLKTAHLIIGTIFSIAFTYNNIQYHDKN